MKLIVVGKNRAEYCNIKRGDQEKHFVKTRGQLYMVMPDSLTRCKCTRFGKRAGDDEIIVFSENASKPYMTGSIKTSYAPSMIVSTIDLEKNTTPKTMFGVGSIFYKINKNKKPLQSMLTFVFVGVILLWAVVFN